MNILAHEDSYIASDEPQIQNEGSEFLNETELTVSDLMNAAMDILNVEASKAKIGLCYEPTKIKINMKVDTKKIRQSIIHIVRNAIKYSNSETSVYVTTGRDFNGDFYIRVDDEGAGIAPDVLERVLAPFNKVENGIESNREAKGLGLNMINSHLKLHFGYLRVQSQLSRGTSVTLTLPKSCLLSR